MRRCILKFFQLPTKEKLLFFEAYTTLGFMRAGIFLFPFKTIIHALNLNENSPSISPVSHSELMNAQEISKAIHRAAKHTPWRSTCLAQALTLHRMLFQRSIPGTFYLGVAKNEINNCELKAHAWGQCGNEILTGKTEHYGFKVISMFSWERKV